MIDILLAAYNGGHFLKEQLDSLLKTAVGDARVLVQDDGSSDDTVEILHAYQNAHPDVIRIVTGPDHEKSAKGNFMSLLLASDGDYLFFSDQDDVWAPDKVSASMQRMREGEAQYGKDCPLLVHTDLAVVDAALTPIASSFWKYQKLDPQPTLARLLAQNSITGCATLINRPLADLMKLGSPQDMLMHDWWAALCAASMGHILTVDKPLIQYRQHGSNQLGATGFDPKRDVKRAAQDGASIQKRLHDTMAQAKAFCTCYESMMPEKVWHLVFRYASLPLYKKPLRQLMLLRHGYLKKGILRALGQLYYI